MTIWYSYLSIKTNCQCVKSSIDRTHLYGSRQKTLEIGITLIVATHNERLSRSMTRVLRLQDGRLNDAI